MSDAKKTCGIVMPISECDGRPASHWADVLRIIESAAMEAGYQARLVSDTFESNLIHKEILQNIYQDEMIICDVSGRNPNVFFELGIRMATQKPTVIIKDDKTAYPFDTGPNRYVGYPRDLRHPAMEKFKADLISAIKNTETQGAENSFIGQLGPFQIPDVESTKLPASDIILDRLDRLERSISASKIDHDYELGIASLSRREKISFRQLDEETVEVCLRGYNSEQIENGIDYFRKIVPPSKKLEIEMDFISTAHSHLTLRGEYASSDELQRNLREAIKDAIPF